MKSYRDYAYQVSKVGERYTFDAYPPVGLAEFDLGDASNHLEADKQAKAWIDNKLVGQLEEVY
jgi:hypothetical protein